MIERIPRPPGLWHALARDDRLNPEEAATQAAVIAAHTPPQPPTTEPPEPPAPSINAPPALRLSPYQSLFDRAGWKPRSTVSEGSARVEAFAPDGAAVMVTAVRGRKVNAYVLPATKKKMPRWRAIAPADLEAFLADRRVVAPRAPVSACTCGKRCYPSEVRAKAAVVDVTIRRVIKRQCLQSERRAYRCPDDVLTWHLTHIEKWYGEKKPKHQKRTKR